MERMQVAVPWNNSRYIPCNGFHPLYRPLFEGGSDFQYNVIDEVAFAKLLQEKSRTVSEINTSIGRMEAPYASIEGTDPIAREFVDYLTMNEFWVTREIPGDIEFHHTSPLTAGNRPFVLHCESFLPIFMPFAYQGRGFTRPVSQVRAFYGHVLGSSNCLGIFSHLPETLEQIRGFFRNPEIDAKLYPSRTGLSDHVFREMSNNQARKGGDRPTFLFTSSANQNVNAFELRGGLVALKFAERYLRSGRDGRFIFRVARPSDSYFDNAGVDLDFLRREEGSRILWLGGYLREREQLRLFAVADVLLLPGVNLHSVTLMQAMAAGTVPVVTDTYGPDRFVDDSETGVVLRGVRGAVWDNNPECGVPIDRHERFPALAPILAEQLFERLTPILDSPACLVDMQVKCRLKAAQEYSGKALQKQFEGDVTRLWNGFIPMQTTKSAQKPVGYFQKHGLLLDNKVLPGVFEGPPHPVLLADTGYCRAYRLKNAYFSIRHGMEFRDWNYSPLELMQKRVLGHGAITVENSLGDLHAELFPMRMVFKTAGWLAFELWWRERLRAYPAIYSTTARIYRVAVLIRWLFNPPLRNPDQPEFAGIRRFLAYLVHSISHGPWIVSWFVRMLRMWRHRARAGPGISRALYAMARFPLVLVRRLYWFGSNCLRELRAWRLSSRSVLKHQAQRDNESIVR